MPIRTVPVTAQPLFRWKALEPWVPGVVLAATAFALWPDLEASFSTPKTAVLGAGAALLAVLALARARLHRIPWPVLAVGLGLATSAFFGERVELQALALEVAGLGLLAAASSFGVDARRLCWAAALTGGALAAVAALQALGVDPLAGLAPRFDGSRLRVYGTLGNPDFVAAFVGATLWPATWAFRDSSGRGRWVLLAVVALHVAALAASRSFATLLGLLPALALFAWATRGRAGERTAPPSATGASHSRSVGGSGRRGVLFLGLAVTAALALSVQGRALDRLAAGRLHLWRTALPALAQAPLFGLGPGAVRGAWPEWQAEQPELSRSEPAFGALQNHLHNDYLERALEQGLLGLAALVTLVLAVLRRGLRAGRPEVLALTAAVASLAARALVDFPLARPAELALFLLCCAAVFHSPSPSPSTREPS